MKNTLKKLMLATMTLLPLMATMSVQADDFPDGDITIIVPKSPGGGTDITTRGLVQFAKQHTDSGFVVVNQPGAGGVVGMAKGARAEADGYHLTMTTVELDILPHLGRSPVKPDAFRFLVAPIAEPAALVVPADSDFDSVEDFVTYAKAHPGELKVGNSGTGAIWHLGALAMKGAYGIDFTDVPYNNGSADAVAALVGKHLDAIVVGPANAKAQVDAGELKLLGIMGDHRLKMFPEIPTFAELGHKITVRAWAALAAPKSIPEARFDKLASIFTATLSDPEFVKYMNRQGIEVNDMNVEQVNAMVKKDYATYADLLKQLNLN